MPAARGLALAACVAIGVGALGVLLEASTRQFPPGLKSPSPSSPAFPSTGDGPPDAQGDPLPAGALLRIGTSRYRDGGSTNEAILSPDGKTVATASEAGIMLFDLATGKRTLLDHRFGRAERLRCELLPVRLRARRQDALHHQCSGSPVRCCGRLHRRLRTPLGQEARHLQARTDGSGSAEPTAPGLHTASGTPRARSTSSPFAMSRPYSSNPTPAGRSAPWDFRPTRRKARRTA